MGPFLKDRTQYLKKFSPPDEQIVSKKTVKFEKFRKIAAILGPLLVAMTTFETHIWKPEFYDTQISPLVYLNGVLIFTGSLFFFRMYHIWSPQWRALITLVGWLGLLLGLTCMLPPQIYKSHFENDAFVFSVQITLIVFGLVLSWQGYRPRRR